MLKTAAVLLLIALPLAAAETDEVKELVRLLKDRDPTVRARAAADSAEVQALSVTKGLLKLVKDSDWRVREAAIESLRTRTVEDDRRLAAKTLAARLPYLSSKAADGEEYLQVIDVLHDLAQPVAVKALLDMGVDEPEDSAAARLMAVGNTPSKEAIEGLIAFISKGRNKGRNRQRDAGIKALRYATGQKLKGDADVWRAWWRENGDRFDFEAAAAARQAERDRLAERERKREENRKKKEEREKRKKEKGKGKGKKQGDGEGD